ncbi:THO complex subunit 3 [Acropora cervicornis]|uniref:THO complex subunit 3 n=1 Tax=Acropora cervicornis TaxID=6130 RepID=A0AAD9QT68_ACRCE|nr:THO complex subunit 3 [Acropora cervicornis]
MAPGDYLNEMKRYFENNSRTKDFIAHTAKVHSVAWSCDGRRLASGSFDRTVSIFVLEKDRLTKETNHKGHGESVDQLCWHPSSSNFLVTASASKCVSVVNTKGENINICWSPDGNTIAVGNKVNEISWNNTNDLFFLTNGHGCINILSYPDLKLQQTLHAHPANCICIKFDPKGRYFATGSADALVSLWDLDELVCVRTFSRLE